MRRGAEPARLRVLVIAPFPPSRTGPHGGSRAVAHLVEGLAGHSDVALVYLRAAGEAAVDARLTTACDTVVELERAPLPTTAAGSRRRQLSMLRGLATRRPMWMSDYCCGASSIAHLDAFSRQWRPDVVQIEYPVMMPVARGVGPGTIRVLTDHDPAYEAALDRARAASGASRAILRLDAMAWRHQERSALLRADVTVTFTEADRVTLQRLAPTSRIEVIPLTVPVPQRRLDAVGVGERLVFVGNFVHQSNRDAAIWLARDILPLIRASVPSADLVLVGEDPRDEIRTALRDLFGVRVTGWVDDPDHYLDEAAVVVAPIRTGGGMRVKVLEAVAAGKAVVTTPRGAAGLSSDRVAQLRVATTAAGLAEATIDLLRRPQARRELGTQARRAAEDERDVNDRGLAYLNLYAAIRADHGR